MRHGITRPARSTASPGPTGQYYEVTHDFDGSANLSTTVAHALADVTGADVTNTELTLNDAVSPDALDALFEPKRDGTPRRSGSLSFSVSGYLVTIYATGQILIQPPQRPA